MKVGKVNNNIKPPVVGEGMSNEAKKRAKVQNMKAKYRAITSVLALLVVVFAATSIGLAIKVATANPTALITSIMMPNWINYLVMIAMLSFAVGAYTTGKWDLMTSASMFSNTILYSMIHTGQKFVVFLLLLVIFVPASINACLDIPLTNSTITTDKRVMYSLGFKAQLRERTKLCTVDLKSNFTMELSIIDVANNFPLKCYKSDDPVFHKERATFNGKLFFDDQSVCKCEWFVFGDKMVPCDATKCQGDLYCVDRRHDSSACKRTPTGYGNWVHYETCLQGWDRFTICQVMDSDSFSMTYGLKKNNQVFNMEHFDSFSITGDVDESARIVTNVHQDKSLVGKFIVIDSKSENKFYVLDKSQVNAWNERDIGKAGWYRRKDTDFYKNKVIEQLTLNIVDCSKNIFDLRYKPIEIAALLDTQEVHLTTELSRSRVFDDTGNVRYSEGFVQASFSNYVVMAYGFMVKDDLGVAKAFGYRSDGSIINSQIIKSSGSVDTPACGRVGYASIEDSFIKFLDVDGKDMKLWLRRYMDMDNQYITYSTKGEPQMCYHMIAWRSGVPVTSFTTILWPSDNVYDCALNTNSGMFDCKMKQTMNVTNLLTVTADNSVFDVFLTTKVPFIVKEPELPKCSSIKMVDGFLIVNDFIGDAVSIIAETCLLPTLYIGTKVEPKCQKSCVGLKKATAVFNGNTICTGIIDLNCTKNVDIEVKENEEPTESKDKFKDLETWFLDWLNILKYYFSSPYIFIPLLLGVICLTIAICAMGYYLTRYLMDCYFGIFKSKKD